MPLRFARLSHTSTPVTYLNRSVAVSDFYCFRKRPQKLLLDRSSRRKSNVVINYRNIPVTQEGCASAELQLVPLVTEFVGMGAIKEVKLAEMRLSSKQINM